MHSVYDIQNEQFLQKYYLFRIISKSLINGSVQFQPDRGCFYDEKKAP